MKESIVYSFMKEFVIYEGINSLQLFMKVIYEGINVYKESIVLVL